MQHINLVFHTCFVIEAACTISEEGWMKDYNSLLDEMYWKILNVLGGIRQKLLFFNPSYVHAD